MSDFHQRMRDRQSGSQEGSAARVEGAPILAGLIGASIQASGSPAMHMEEARAAGLDYSYKLFDLDHIDGGASALPRVLDQVQREGFAGVNITYPCKQAVIPLLHALSPDAEALGAVNTVVFDRGRRTGHNTDCIGFYEGLTHGLPNAALGCVAVIGAGGGGAAVTYALLEKGARRVVTYDVEAAKASALASRMAAQFPDAEVVSSSNLAATARDCDGFVNCTPIGMIKYPGTPISPELIEQRHWVADIVYFPLETELLRLARERGCATLDGGGMAVFQAAEAFRLFSGHTPDHARMMERFRGQTPKRNEAAPH